MKILVIDDHALIREALREILKELKGDISIVEAPDWERAARYFAEDANFDLALLDLNLPDRDGFEILAEIGERHPAIAVVVLSAQHDQNSVAKALNLGAVGYIPKSVSREVMLSAFNLIFAGGMYIPPDILVHQHPAPKQSSLPAETAGREGSTVDLGLTRRQLDVLALMMKGSSNKKICRALDLAEATVKNHVTAILRALKVNNRTEAVVAAKALGFESRQPEE